MVIKPVLFKQFQRYLKADLYLNVNIFLSYQEPNLTYAFIYFEHFQKVSIPTVNASHDLLDIFNPLESNIPISETFFKWLYQGFRMKI